MNRYIAICLVLAGCVHAPPPKVPPPAGPEATKLVLANFPGPGESNLAALKGQVVLLDFWATWCGPCHDAAKGVEKLHQRYGLRVVVYGISIDDDPADIPEFLKQQGVTYPILLDPGAALAGPRFGLESIPAMVLIDRAGNVRFGHAGFDDAEAEQIVRELDTLLAEPATVRP